MTSWGSRNAEDLFKIAVNLAGFDRKELMLEIHRRSARRKSDKVNEATILQAMQTVEDRDKRTAEAAGVLHREPFVPTEFLTRIEERRQHKATRPRRKR